MPTSRSYHSSLIQSLKDPLEAAAYLDAVLEDCSYEELLLAVRNVVEAKLAVVDASQINCDRETLTEFISSNSNIDVASLLKTISSLGFRVSIRPRENAA